MKKMFKHTEAVIGGILLLIVVFSGCQKSNIGDGETIPLRKVAENKEYVSIPLVDTKWKLLGFVNEKQKTIKLASPDGGNSYTILLRNDGYIEGNTSTNGAHGQFMTERDNSLTIQFSAITEINEIGDGEFYIESMKRVSQFRIDRKGLALIYDNNKYLLFQPYSVEK